MIGIPSSTFTPAHLARSAIFWTIIATAAFLLSMYVSPSVGHIGIDRGWPTNPDLLAFRLQRVLAAAIVGFALSAAGVTLQALLRNPLADPYVLGISSGSTVGIMLWMVLLATVLKGLDASASDTARFFLTLSRAIPAVAGAIFTCILVFLLARGRWTGTGGGGASGLQPVTLLLVGVVISSMNAAILMLLNSLAPHQLKSDFATFLLGSISDGELSTNLLRIAGAVLLAGYLPTLLSAQALNIGTLSDTEAISLGVNVQRLRTIAFLCASIMTGAAILLSGPIGFVGLICPHICRRLRFFGGADHRTLLISAPLCGAAFLMLADSAVRVSSTLKLGPFPVGVVTALCGGPFFLFLLRRRSSN